jgi:hypothetical protein
MIKIKPRCLDNNKLKELNYSASGYLLPCCWVDSDLDSIEQFGLLNIHLKLENVKNIEEIMQSNEWNNLYRLLTEDQENAPDICKRHCGLNSQSKEFCYD